MRLVCPNCAAQYEVGDDVIPAAGRDVQCSNCGHTWFEAPGEAAAVEEIVAPVPAHQEPELEAQASQAQEAEATPEPEKEIIPDREPARVDPTVADILQEEATREENVRAAERGDPIESQPDFGLEDQLEAEEDLRAQETKERLSKLRGDEAIAATAAAVAAATRKEMLPDIEEINSTLRSSEERGDDIAPEPEVVEQTKKRGFRTGFFGVLLIVLILVVLYMFAPRLASMVPALEGPLNSYVDLIYSGRSWLDGLLSGLRDSMQSAIDANGS